MMSLASIVGAIVDEAYNYNVRVYSVMANSWKNKVLGTSRPVVEPFKGVKNPQKVLSVKKAISLGFEKELRVCRAKNSFFSYNDDLADAICISLYCFCDPPYYVELEE